MNHGFFGFQSPEGLSPPPLLAVLESPVGGSTAKGSQLVCVDAGCRLALGSFIFSDSVFLDGTRDNMSPRI